MGAGEGGQSRKGRRLVVGKDGVWREGKAAPEHLREDLRVLPSDLITKEDADEAKIHELDAPHIVKSLEHEYWEDQKKESAPRDKLLDMGLAQVGEVVPLSPKQIAAVKLRVTKILLEGCIKAAVAGEDVFWGPWHLNFPSDNVNHYEGPLKGKAPPDYKRKKHLRKLDLDIDIISPTRDVRVFLEEAGIEPWDLKAAFDKQQRAREIQAEFDAVG